MEYQFTFAANVKTSTIKRSTAFCLFVEANAVV